MRKDQHIRNFVCVSAFVVLLGAGCSKKDQGEVPTREEEKVPVVATVGKSAITTDDFNGYLAQRPIRQRSRDSADGIKTRLDELILEEVLYQEALRLELDREPDVRRRIRQLLVQQLMGRQIDGPAKNFQVEERDIEGYYDQHRDAFNRPAQVRLADIFVAVPPTAPGEEKNKLKKKAEAILGEALAVRGKRSGFGALIRKYSDNNEKYGRGDTGFFDESGMPIGIDKALVAAAFRIERVGQMPEHVIETPDGYHVVMLTGKRSAINRPMDTVRNQIIQQIRRDRVKKEREEFIQNLKAKADIAVDEKVLAKMAVEAAGPMRKPSSMPEGADVKRPESPRRPPAFPGEK